MSASVRLDRGERVVLVVDELLPILGGVDDVFAEGMGVGERVLHYRDSKWVRSLGSAARFLFPQVLFSDLGHPNVEMFTAPHMFGGRFAYELVNSDFGGDVNGWFVSNVDDPVQSGFFPVAFPFDGCLAVLYCGLPFNERVRLLSNLVCFYGYFVCSFRDGVRAPRDLVRSFGLTYGFLRSVIGDARDDDSGYSDQRGDDYADPFGGDCVHESMLSVPERGNAPLQRGESVRKESLS